MASEEGLRAGEPGDIGRYRDALTEIYQSGYSCADYARVTAGQALGRPTDKVGGGRQCAATTQEGHRCPRSANPHKDYCWAHG